MNHYIVIIMAISTTMICIITDCYKSEPSDWNRILRRVILFSIIFVTLNAILSSYYLPLWVQVICQYIPLICLDNMAINSHTSGVISSYNPSRGGGYHGGRSYPPDWGYRPGYTWPLAVLSIRINAGLEHLSRQNLIFEESVDLARQTNQQAHIDQARRLRTQLRESMQTIQNQIDERENLANRAVYAQPNIRYRWFSVITLRQGFILSMSNTYANAPQWDI